MIIKEICMPTIWDEKIAQTTIELKVESDRIVMNHATWGTSGVTCFDTTKPIYLHDLLESLRLTVREDQRLHCLSLTISSPYINYNSNDSDKDLYTNISHARLHEILYDRISKIVPEQVKLIKEAKKAKSSCLIL
jgi:hypothetical protein